ncbi:hypothetical protein AMATHDRAFT_73753 [Amanita thiersii Skay4041]|uniref:Xaa-Pro dipeptidyl-peptidase-like domain-containing protein n=1 Tax=Amanita thiersii Skay4041 TaxID=703135 RepID=A0A2A9NX24_9AGAR|nr:hypothetical protein AMATHDRAFT_73753 [Amanita thiersii Skay4041]
MLVPLPTGVSLQLELTSPEPVSSQRQNSLAVLLHPWSWLGGQMHDPVLSLLARLLKQHGYYIIRFNSRGVGSSTGRSSFTGLSEGEDLTAVVQWSLGQISNVGSVVLIGYSHGGLIASLHPVLGQGINTSHVLLSYPLSPRGWLTMFHSNIYQRKLEELAREERSNILIIYGDSDEFTGATKYREWAAMVEREGGGRVSVVAVEGGSHFWAGEGGAEMGKAICDWLS